MTESLQPETPAGDDLQFENAEYAAEAPSALACAGCAREIAGTYYEVNGKMLCPDCREAIVRELGGGMSATRFLRAFLFGTIAAVVGAALWYGVIKLTNIQSGLIAILLGFMVGIAVRSGSRQRGGFVYQAMAVLLTYMSISASYMALGIEQFFAAEAQEMRGAEEVKDAANAPKEGEAEPGADAKPKANANAKAKAKDQLNAGKEEIGPAGVAASGIAFLVVLLGLFATLPVLANLESPIVLLIIAFALWEAWKLNKRTKLEINGPYEVSGGGTPPATGLPSHA